jgi:exopolysaccharide biosynthesis polyprenyl glycosylphosphotransferase
MKSGVRTIILFLGDAIAMLASFFLMIEIAFPEKIIKEVIGSHLFPFSIISCVWLFIFFLFNLYETQSIKPTIPHLKKIGIASIVSLITSIILFYIIPAFGITPKTNLIIFSIVFIFLFLIWRRIFYNVFAIYLRKSVIFIVDLKKDPNAEELISYIKNCPQSGFFILNTYSSLKKFLEQKNEKQINTLVISKNILDGVANLKSIYNKAEHILDLTDAYENILGKIPTDSINETWFLYNIYNTDKTFHDVIIRVVNIMVAFIIFLITFPFSIIVVLFIFLEREGPIFYTQLRVGKNDKNFRLYKFRSMIINADKNGAQWTEKNDPRITKVGKIIRKLHIDEVPQLWNVIKGDMSLVGPRPELPIFVQKLEEEVPYYNLRHIIKPGFTGWAQIKYRNARGVRESKEKFEYDLYYIKNRNIFMDLGILLKTIQIIFTH